MAGKTSKKSAKVAKKAVPKRVASKPALLAGGNPQVPKADGDTPVQAYIAAMPGWKRDVGRRLDAIIVRTVPGVRKAVKWNSPLYGVEGEGWFLGIHCFTNYVKVAFFRGTSLRPIPPGESNSKDTRYLDIHEDDEIDDAQLAAWVKQASLLPGEFMGATMKKAATTLRRTTSGSKEGREGGSPSQLIDARIAALRDWQGETLARVRSLIREACPDVVEDVKWRKPSNPMLGVPVWEHAGIICTGETYKDKVKLTFAEGASLKDPTGLFNASLEGNTRRAIDFHEGDKIDEKALKNLIRAAVALNTSTAKS